mmetsp:Transcript_106552/g.200671  ORF Transcript_106552/g.200671 Transcript_106552/m.200671 type:complete len:213 (-) Transcript_106552:28-666(-)
MLTTPSSPLPTRRNLDSLWEPPRTPTPYKAEPLLLALQANSLDQVVLAIEEDETSVFLPLRGLGRGWHDRVPPLLEAVRHGCSVEVLQVLLEHGADADSKDAKGMNALTELVGGRYMREKTMTEDEIYERARLLLWYGADPWCQDAAGQFMAIRCAHCHGLTRVVDLLRHWDGRLAKCVLDRWWGRLDKGMCVSSQVSMREPLSDMIFGYVA